MEHARATVLKKHADTSKFVTLLIYILYGAARRFEWGIPFILLIICGGLNFLYALWVLYFTIRQRKNIPKYSWALVGSMITLTVAAGIFFLSFFK